MIHIQNFQDGYVKVICKRKQFIMQLPYNTKRIIRVGTICENTITALCESFDGREYVKWISLEGIPCMHKECTC